MIRIAKRFFRPCLESVFLWMGILVSVHLDPISYATRPHDSCFKVATRGPAWHASILVETSGQFDHAAQNHAFGT